MSEPSAASAGAVETPTRTGLLGFLLDFHNRTILFRVGNWIVTTYALLTAISFATGVAVGLWFDAMTGQDVMFKARYYLFVLTPLSLIGVRSFSIMLEWRELLKHPLATIVKPGYMLHGGILGGSVALWLLWRASGLDLLLLLDAGAFALLIGEAIARLGCYVYGCCWGRPTDSRFGVRYTSPHAKVVRCAPHLQGVKIHPAQLYATVAYATMFVIFYALLPYRRFDGMFAALYLIGHSVVRLTLERFRQDDRGRFFGILTHTQLYATIMILLGIAIFVARWNGGPLTPADVGIRFTEILGNGTLMLWILGFGLAFGIPYGVHYKKVGQWISKPGEDDEPAAKAPAA